jgi:MFS family permease
VVAFFAVLGTASGVWLARIPAVKQHLHLSDGMLGLALLAAPAGLVLVVLLAGRVVDRIGSRRPVLIAGFCVALLPISLGLASSMAALMAGLFAFGLAGGMLDVAMNAQAVHVERGYGRPLMTSFHACYSFGGLAGSLFGGLFAWAGVSPVVNFLAAGVPMAAVTLLAGPRLLGEQAIREQEQAARDQEQAGQEQAAPERADLAAETLTAAASAGRVPAAWTEPIGTGRPRWSVPVLVLGLLALCSLLSEGSADGWSAVYLHDSVGTSAAFAALGYAAFSVMMALGRLTGDRLALRFGPVALVRGGGLLAAGGLAVALISADPVGALVGFALFGAGLSCTFPQLLSAAGNADPAHPAVGIARVAGLGYVGMLGGPVLIGSLASVAGLSVALGVPVILALCIAAGAGEVRPRRASRAPR